MLFFEVDFFVFVLVPMFLLTMIGHAAGCRIPLSYFGIPFSLLFLYASGPLSVAVLLASIAVNYVVARALLEHRSQTLLLAGVAANIAVLGYFKYSLFLERDVIGAEVFPAWSWALPLGISFYTFQQIAFIADIYQRKVTSFRGDTYVMFKVFYPQFIAGPITHYNRVASSYEREAPFNARSLRYGLAIFAIGLAKKLIGDHFGAIANGDFARQETLDLYSAWVGMLAFTFQIYFDFSGYSDMALGIARLFGVSLPVNFNSPYKARNVSEFWRRWHITLSQWLRDYLYISLGGNRHGMALTICALLVTMVLGGFWHGAGWTFLAWGLAHGVALVAYRFFPTTLPRALSHFLLFLFVAITWVLFRSETLTGAMQHYAALVHARWGVATAPSAALQQAKEVVALALAAAACLFLPNSQQIALWLAARKVALGGDWELLGWSAVIAALAICFLIPDTPNEFIYFQF